MAKRMLIDALHPEETRVAIADENQIYDFDFVSTAKKQLKGNIYLAKITRVEPSLQAAFVEYGGNKQGFLPFSEIHADYYQIPVSDRKRLIEEMEQEIHDEAEEPKLETTETHSHDDHSTEQQPSEPNPYAGQEPASELEVTDHTERPAYLTEGAIDISTSSEEIEEPAGESEQAETPLEPLSEIPVEAMAETSEMPSAETSENSGSSEAKNEEVETLPNEEEYRPKKPNFSKRYKIQEVIRRGQIVLVQVIKEERGNKGVSLTTYLSLPGRYCVLMPNSPKDGGISRKIASGEDRKRLKAIATELRLAQGMSVIVRTAGMDRTRAEIKRDYDYLVKLWNQIREDTLSSTAPALVYEESDIIKRAVRDQYTSDIDEIVIEGEAGYKAAKDFMKLLMPSHTPKIKHYEDPTPLFYAYNIEEQLLSMHDPVVKLRSGGYLVINPTEALISIDVNSGRATGERNIEETATKTNLEAVAEVARQLRLRDLAGLIVIDLIDMMESRNRRAVEKALKDALKADRAKIQLGRISPFGLMEMSRQRLRPSISETNMVQCPHCVGRGVIRSNESMSIQMIRSIEKEASAGTWGSLRVLAPQGVTLHILNTKRNVLKTIEERYNVTIQVLINPDLTSSEFNLEKMRRAGERGERNESEHRDRDRNRGRRPERDRERPRFDAPVESAEVAEGDGSNITEVGSNDGREDVHASNDNRRNRGGRGRNRRGGRNRNDRGPRHYDNNQQPPQPAGDNVIPIEATEGQAPAEGAPAPEGNEVRNDRPPRDNRNRGGRGRRRWRDKNDRGEQGDNRGPRQDAPAEAPHVDKPAAATPERQERPRQLPAFATEKPVMIEPPAKAYATANAPPPLQEQRNPNAPVKKGWWQKMIDLD